MINHYGQVKIFNRWYNVKEIFSQNFPERMETYVLQDVETYEKHRMIFKPSQHEESEREALEHELHFQQMQKALAPANEILKALDQGDWRIKEEPEPETPTSVIQDLEETVEHYRKTGKFVPKHLRNGLEKDAGDDYE